jgi:hypothetical protein
MNRSENKASSPSVQKATFCFPILHSSILVMQPWNLLIMQVFIVILDLSIMIWWTLHFFKLPTTSQMWLQLCDYLIWKLK